VRFAADPLPVAVMHCPQQCVDEGELWGLVRGEANPDMFLKFAQSSGARH
jgi:hypothetical protein